MFATILSWVMKSKGVKLGAGVMSGGGLIALIFNLNASITTRIDKQDALHKEFVGLSLKPIETEINTLKDDQKDIKTMVRDIHSYLLKSK